MPVNVGRNSQLPFKAEDCHQIVLIDSRTRHQDCWSTYLIVGDLFANDLVRVPTDAQAT
jgi:hypothetical protein